MEAKIFVPSHAVPTENIRPLVQKNRACTEALIGEIVCACEIPIGFEALLKRLFDRYGLSMSLDQYALVGSTVRSYLSYLADAERIAPIIVDNALLWEKK
jgi:hypothetical protein